MRRTARILAVLGRLGAGRAAGAMVLGLALVLSACTTVLVRSPVAENDVGTAAPYGIEGGFIREWGDALSRARSDEILEVRVKRLKGVHAAAIAAGGPIREDVLALSGGGPDGAFGAGFLRGWTERGDRPEFTMVTGISTGAIIAVFAFLGPEHDDTLEEIYTTYRTEQLLTRTIFAALTGGTAITDTSGYRRLIERYIDETVMARLAEEHRQGRVLLIGTTNLDAARPVIWNVTAIAASGHPEARRLVHDVVQASSAIPAAFPPVLIPVLTEDGQRRDEMHVDGGATQQVIFFSPEFPLRRIDEALGVRFERRVFVVVNNKLRKTYEPVRPRVVAIAGKAASSLIGGAGTGDIYKIYAMAARDGMELNVMSIPPDFTLEPKEAFDPVYMRRLYDLGRHMGQVGESWLPHPPDFVPYP